MAKPELDKITGYLAFVSIAKAKLKYKSTTEYEYAASVVVSEDEAELFEDKGLNKKVKEVKTAEFEEKYKFAPPFPDQKKQYLITFAQNTHSRAGTPLPDFLTPKAYRRREDQKLEDITTIEIGNGSYGTIRYSILPIQAGQASEKPSVKLHSLCVEQFVSYSKNTDEWAAEVVGTAPQREALAPTVGTAAPTAEQAEDYLDDDLPF